MSILKNKSLLEWFVSFGKTKGTILHLSFLALLMIVFSVLHSLIFKQKFIPSLSDSSFFILAFALAVANSSDFYNNALASIKKEKELQESGLTATDIDNMQFLKAWEELRGNGFYKYIFFNGGLILGSILFIVVSFVLFPKAKAEGRQVEELSDMLMFMLKCYVVGFLLGSLSCFVRWNLNERKFRRLKHLFKVMH